LLSFVACKVENKKEVMHQSAGLKYAKRFSLTCTKNYTLVSVFGNRANFDTTAIFFLAKELRFKDAIRPNQQFVQVPCKNMAVLSCIYTNMLTELGALSLVSAIDNIDYVNDSNVISKFKRGGIVELARTPEINLEKCLQLQPDMLFTFGMGDLEKDSDHRLANLNIPIAIVLDHLEEHPLARAEWIRFFAAFVDRLPQADSIFNRVENDYHSIKEKAKRATSHPKVFSEIKFGDVWYMPGGKSFMAILIGDAGGTYAWREDNQSGSLPLSLEQVLVKAGDAEIWLNQPLIFSKQALLAADPRYEQFRAFKENRVYNNIKVRNQNGYSSYWETGMLHPERILSDLFQIFHPEINQSAALYYYEQLH
jgi:iron complex transport system substrate-binding protein